MGSGKGAVSLARVAGALGCMRKPVVVTYCVEIQFYNHSTPTYTMAPSKSVAAIIRLHSIYFEIEFAHALLRCIALTTSRCSFSDLNVATGA